LYVLLENWNKVQKKISQNTKTIVTARIIKLTKVERAKKWICAFLKQKERGMCILK
jgi:hypothetical protein